MLRDKTWIIARGSSADRVDALRSVEVKLPRAPVAQLDRVLVSEAKGHRFDSCRARHSTTALSGAPLDYGGTPLNHGGTLVREATSANSSQSLHRFFAAIALVASVVILGGGYVALAARGGWFASTPPMRLSL